MDRVTFATSSGMVWLALAVHFAVGLVSIVAGAVALSAAKGGWLHKRSGLIFTSTMAALGLTAMGIGIYENNTGQVFSGLLAAYFVISGMTTVKPFPGMGQRSNIVMMVVAFIGAAMSLYGGVAEWLNPAIPVTGRPRVVPPLIIGTIILLAAIGDLRAIRVGGLHGSRRLARHLWRMCFGFFIATGAFFLGQMAFVPGPLRITPLLLVLAFAPIVFLFYWLWRVRDPAQQGLAADARKPSRG